MKVVAIPKVYLFDLSLRKVMDAARFFSLASCLSPLHVTNFFHDVILALSQGHSQILPRSPIFLHGSEIKSGGGLGNVIHGCMV